MRFLIQRRLPQPTRVFDSYWEFAAERQRIFRARLRGERLSLTDNEVLATFKFTNAYRASDRTSQYLLRTVIYDRPRPFRDVFARVLLFKLFNRIETWRLLSNAVGELNAMSIGDPALEATLTKAASRGRTIYSAAYIMPSASSFGSRKKHVNHLRLLASMLDAHADDQISRCNSMSQAFDVLLNFPSIGPFLAYQLITDLNYSDHLYFSEAEFVEPGPGALDGIEKCFQDLGAFTPSEVIRWAMETQDEQFEARGITFQDLWGRPLQLIDCQNLFCEVAKYARVAHPSVAGSSGRTRIKQRFHPKTEPLSAWYPPKWGINRPVRSWLERHASQRHIHPSLFQR